MNIKDLKTALPYLFQAEVTPFIWGHAGIGKSTVAKQVAQSLGYKFFPFYLGTQSDIGDILGLAEFVTMPNGSKATAFAIPKWLMETIDYCNENPASGAIIFLDEFNRGRRDILNGMFSLALDKTFHTIKLPKNCHIIAAGNPPTDEYFTTDVNETALMARFCHIKLEPSFQEWVNYAKDSKFEPSLVSFLQEQPELLEESRQAFTLPVKVDRRAYERANRLFAVETPAPILDQLLVGIIGAERLVAYHAHMKNAEKPLTADEVFDGRGLSKLTVWSDANDTKSSLVSATNDNVFDWVKATTAISPAQYANLMTFLETIPRDMSYDLLTRLSKADLESVRTFFRNQDFEKRLLVIIEDAQDVKAKQETKEAV